MVRRDFCLRAGGQGRSGRLWCACVVLSRHKSMVLHHKD